MSLTVIENLQLIESDAKNLQVRIHNVLSLVTMYDTSFVQILIQLPNWNSNSPEAYSSCNLCLKNIITYL